MQVIKRMWCRKIFPIGLVLWMLGIGLCLPVSAARVDCVGGNYFEISVTAGSPSADTGTEICVVPGAYTFKITATAAPDWSVVAPSPNPTTISHTFTAADAGKKVIIAANGVVFHPNNGRESDVKADVTVTVLKVEFDKDPVKVGIGATRTSETAVYPATTPATYPHRLIATITPKSAAGAVTFDSSSVARATVAEVSRTDVGNTKQVVLKVTGVAETPVGSPGGDADIRALLNGTTCKTTKAIVIKPTSRTHATAGATIQNTTTLLPGGGTVLKSETFQIVTITIKDQFGKVLHAVYNGQNVVEEKFENVSNGGLATTWTAINIPDRDLINGIKLDETGFVKQLAITTTLTAAQQAAWTAGTLMINGANNTFKLTGFNFTTEGDMKLRVDGHAVSPDIHRKLVASAANHPPVPSTTTETVIP